jgi:hypothetical protein
LGRLISCRDRGKRSFEVVAWKPDFNRITLPR